MLDFRIVNGECEKADFEGNGNEWEIGQNIKIFISLFLHKNRKIETFIFLLKGE